MTETYTKLMEARQRQADLEAADNTEAAETLRRDLDGLEPNIIHLEICDLQDQVDKLAPIKGDEFHEMEVRALDDRLDELHDRLGEISC